MPRIVTTVIFVLYFCVRLHAQTAPTHTVILILENKSFNQIINNANAPYINSLVGNPHTAVLTRSFGLTHPSQPNYLMLFSGSNQGVTDNNVPPNLPFITLNLGGSLINSGHTFIGYSEDLPAVGSNDSIVNAYYRKHNPWVNWQGSAQNGIPATSNRPFTDFPSDYNLLSTLSFVVPNVNNDMHDGTVTTGDTWIKNNLDNYIKWCINNNSLLIITFDEDDSGSGNSIATLFIGANINGGNYSQPVTHYNVLRTLEDLYQLPYAGVSRDSSAIQDIWVRTLALSNFNLKAQQHHNNVLVSWTGSSTNASSYIIERSANGNEFKSIGTVKATNTNAASTNYMFSDVAPLPSANFYRIRQVDIDNKFEYSATAFVAMNSANSAYTIYPMPAKDFINITSTNAAAKNVTIALLDERGTIVESKKATIIPGSALQLSLQHIAKGSYFLRITSDGNETSIVRCIKN